VAAQGHGCWFDSTKTMAPCYMESMASPPPAWQDICPPKTAREYGALKQESRFLQDWFIDARNKVIARRGKGKLADRLDLLWWRRHHVETLYCVVHEKALDPAIVMSGPGIDRSALEGPPTFRLCLGWRIPQDDLRYLRKGPLFSEEGALLVGGD
jgi:hypothetical protein